MTSVLLHGFWGQPEDWLEVLARLPIGQKVLCPDLYDGGSLAPREQLERWPTQFWAWVDHAVGPGPITLVGYSMGGRLAASAVLARPERVDRALLLSAQPYWREELWPERRSWEAQWKQRFLQDEWAQLERDWQDLPVFAAGEKLARRQSPGMRELLGQSLTQWSPTQSGLTARSLAQLSPRVEWAFGALDQKYHEVAKSLQSLPVQGQITMLPGVGHRVLKAAPEFISQWLKR